MQQSSELQRQQAELKALYASMSSHPVLKDLNKHLDLLFEDSFTKAINENDPMVALAACKRAGAYDSIRSYIRDMSRL